MENNNTTVGKVGLRFGLIVGLILVIYSLILQLLDLADKSALGYISYAIIIGGIVMGSKVLKEDNGYMSYGQGLGLGTLISVISGFMSSVFLFIYLTFIDDNMIEKIREQAMLDMEKQNIPEAQMEQAVSWMETFTSPTSMLIMGTIATAFIGFIISLITAAIVKKNKPEF